MYLQYSCCSCSPSFACCFVQIWSRGKLGCCVTAVFLRRSNATSLRGKLGATRCSASCQIRTKRDECAVSCYKCEEWIRANKKKGPFLCLHVLTQVSPICRNQMTKMCPSATSSYDGTKGFEATHWCLFMQLHFYFSVFAKMVLKSPAGNLLAPSDCRDG